MKNQLHNLLGLYYTVVCLPSPKMAISWDANGFWRSRFSENWLFFAYEDVFDVKKSRNYPTHKSFSPPKSFVSICLKNGTWQKGWWKGWWVLCVQFCHPKVKITEIFDFGRPYAIYTLWTCATNIRNLSHPFHHPFSNRFQLMNHHWEICSIKFYGFLTLFGATSELQMSIKIFHHPFLQHRKVQNLNYILTFYDYSQKCMVIDVQTHFRKTN